jgi:hypothetical protein
MFVASSRGQIHESSDQLDRDTRNAEMKVKELKLDNERLMSRERERAAALQVVSEGAEKEGGIKKGMLRGEKFAWYDA